MLWAALASGLAAAATLLCLAVYVGLLPYGRWQEDEYRLLLSLRQWGWSFYWARLDYSPRPFSEALLALYGEAVLGVGRPLIGSALALLWSAGFGAVWLAASISIPRGGWRRAGPGFLVAGALAAGLLLGGPVSELFYWPMAAAAYLPTLAAIACFVLLQARPDAGGAWSGLALLVAAASSEMGAAFALAATGLVALAALLSRRQAPAGEASRSFAWLLPASALALWVFWRIGQGRLGLAELGAENQALTGHATQAMLAGLGRQLGELAAPLTATGPAATGWITALLRLVLAAAAGLAWRGAGARVMPKRALAASAALGLAAWFSLAAAYYHYGAACCERQFSTRLGLDELLVVVALAALTLSAEARRRLVVPTRLLLASTIGLGLLLRGTDLASSYQNRHYAVDARARTWRSGGAGGAGMIAVRMPDGVSVAVHGTGLPKGIWQEAPQTPGELRSMLAFFGKRRVNVCEAWQDEHEWLVGGDVIPACVSPP